MSNLFPIWTKNEKRFEPKEATYILAFWVKKTGDHSDKGWWQIEKLEVTYDDDGISLHYCGGDRFDDWIFQDAEFYIECED